jgi:hypothetical protein
MKTYLGSGGIAPRILNLDTRWRWVVSIVPWPLHPRRETLYPLDRRLGGPRAGFDAMAKTKTPALLGNRSPVVQSVASTLHWLGYSGCFYVLLSDSRDSSVGIGLGYRLDDRGSRVRFPAGTGNFSLNHRVQTGSGAHPASYPMGTVGSFPGGKAAGERSWPLTSI